MAGSGKKSRFAEIGLLGPPHGDLHRIRRLSAFGNVVDRQQDLPFAERPVADFADFQHRVIDGGSSLDADRIGSVIRRGDRTWNILPAWMSRWQRRRCVS